MFTGLILPAFVNPWIKVLGVGFEPPGVASTSNLVTRLLADLVTVPGVSAFLIFLLGGVVRARFLAVSGTTSFVAKTP